MTKSNHFRVSALVAAILAAGLLALAKPAWATDFTVNSTADAVDATSGDGTCATAGGACTLRAAIQQANASAGPDTITVPAGTYTLSIPNDKDQFQSDIPEDQSAKGDLDIRSNMTINGAGADSTTVNGGDLDRIFDLVAFTGATADISGLTITNGNVQTSEDGGGISVGFGTTLDLDDSTVSDNTVFFRGGGIKNLGTLTMTNTAVSDNTAENGTGGGIQNVGILTMTDSTVSDNTAPKFGVGGGIDNNNGLTGITATVTMTNSAVSGNTSAHTGAGAGRAGGISNNNGGILTIMDSTVSNNTATNTSGGGFAGGIENRGSTLTMTGSTVSGNSADVSGGGIYSETSPTISSQGTTIKNSTISGNSVAGAGANSVGGGIYNVNGRTVVENTTITDNTAPANQGSGVASATGSSASTELLSTVVSANTNTDADIVFGQTNSFVSNDYNLIGDGNATGAFNQPGDSTGVSNPMLEPLTNNGGSTLTHALQIGSPAIDTGPPVVPDANGRSCPPPATDQRGEERLRDGDGDGTTRCDIGAFELLNTPSDLSIDKLAPRKATQKAKFAYTLKVTNNGPSEASDVQVTDPLPKGVSFVRKGTDSRCAYDPSTREVRCELGTLASSDTEEVVIRVKAKTPGAKANTASVSGDTTDPNDNNNSDTATTKIKRKK